MAAATNSSTASATSTERPELFTVRNNRFRTRFCVQCYPAVSQVAPESRHALRRGGADTGTGSLVLRRFTTRAHCRSAPGVPVVPADHYLGQIRLAEPVRELVAGDVAGDGGAEMVVHDQVHVAKGQDAERIHVRLVEEAPSDGRKGWLAERTVDAATGRVERGGRNLRRVIKDAVRQAGGHRPA